MPPHRFESEVESFLEGSRGDRTHNKQQADHHTVTPLCGTLPVLRIKARCRDGWARSYRCLLIPLGVLLVVSRRARLATGDRDRK